jgi:hypothetical protein
MGKMWKTTPNVVVKQAAVCLRIATAIEKFERIIKADRFLKKIQVVWIFWQLGTCKLLMKIFLWILGFRTKEEEGRSLCI